VKRIRIILCFCLLLLGLTPIASVSAAAASVPPGLVDLVVEFPRVDATVGESFSFGVYIKNYDTAARNCDFTISGPDGWTLTLTPEEDTSKQISTVKVAANGGVQNLIIFAEPPGQEPAGPGEYPITLSATSGSTQTSVNMVAIVHASYILLIQSGSEETKINATIGRGSVVSLDIKNNGTSPITDIVFSSEAPKGWQVAISPEGISSLKEQAHQAVDLTITPPSGTAPGDRYVTFRAIGTETTASVVIRVRAKSPAVWGWIVLAAAVLLAAGIVYWRVYQRRKANPR
jgi:uncharacterized membrane protein